MKLTGKLKEKVEKAKTKTQAKELIANAGMELTDDEMNMVSGGGEAQTHTAPMECGSGYDYVEARNREIQKQLHANMSDPTQIRGGVLEQMLENCDPRLAEQIRREQGI